MQGIVDRLVTKYGTLDEALRVLAGENYEYRDTIRQREDTIADLRTKVIPDGGLVLTGDEKKAWEAIKALPVPVDKVAERVTRAGELEAAQQAAETQQLHGKAAQALGWNPEVLSPLLSSNGYTLELRPVQVQGADGTTTEKLVPHVRKAAVANSPWEKLEEVAPRDFKAFLPALTKLPAQGASGDAAGNGAGSQGESVFPFPAMSDSPPPGGGADVVSQHLAKMNQRAATGSNPFLPKRSSTAAAS